MLKQILAIMISTCMVFSTVSLNAKNDKTVDVFKVKKLTLFDFDRNLLVSNTLGRSGIYDENPDDAESFCRSTIEKDDTLHINGYHMKLYYKLNPKLSSANGWWTKLDGINLSDYKAISMTVKGDKNKGYSDSFKIILKGKTQRIESVVYGITQSWKNVTIPFYRFNEFMGLDLSKLDELVIMFEGSRMKVKEGAYLIDDISFIPKN
jgi:hypothetical protein